MSRFILALDQGTTSSRSILFDTNGCIVAKAQQEFPQYFPQSGWVEHDALELWTSQAQTISQVLTKADVSVKDLAAVGISNQRETTVLWERSSGRPIAPAIVWQDRRTAQLCAELAVQGLGHEITQRTGLLLDPYFSGTKLLWLLDHIPHARQRAERGELAFGTIDSWLIWQLTNGKYHITDASNASRTLLFNIHKNYWDPYLLQALRIPASCLPEVVSSSLAIPIPVSINGIDIPLGGIAGDQHAALFGQACFNKGMAKNTYGTGCFLLLNTGEQPQASKHGLLTTLGWRDQASHYALEGSVFAAGAVVQWLRDGLGIIKKASDIESLATRVPDTGGVYFVPAFTGLGCPHWQPHARGTITGLSRGTTAAHLARAALEAIAFQTAEVLQAMQKDTGHRLHELRVDGGAAASDFLLQFQADLLSVPVVRAKVLETSGLGAAYLAGLSVGLWSDKTQLANLWQMERRFIPQMPRTIVDTRLQEWSAAITASNVAPDK
jgi:glycerol kinase